MSAFLPPVETYAVFVSAAVAVILAAGPDTVFVLAQGTGGESESGRARGARRDVGRARPHDARRARLTTEPEGYTEVVL